MYMYMSPVQTLIPLPENKQKLGRQKYFISVIISVTWLINKRMFSYIKGEFTIDLVKIYTASVWKFDACTHLSFTTSILYFDVTYESM